MKLSLLLSALLVSQASAFTASSQQQSLKSTGALNLFGGGNKDGEKKAPGMMDQFAMFKKAQEMATKKKKIDEELQKIDFEGVSADGKVKGKFKYVPVSNPMDPNPDYEAMSFEFDDAFFEASSPADLAAAAKSAIENGIEKTNEAVAEKYAALQADLMEALGQSAPKQE
jgi:hypothetical protein